MLQGCKTEKTIQSTIKLDTSAYVVQLDSSAYVVQLVRTLNVYI